MGDGSSLAVLGFRPHTYWTAVVALTGRPDALRVVARRRIDFAAGRERFVYHQARALGPIEGQALIGRVRAAVEANAAREIGRLVADLRGDGAAVRVAVAPAAAARLPEALEDILRVHARMHAAEGDFYRDAVAQACAALGLRVHRIAERDLPPALAEALGVDAAGLEARLHALGAALGPPWNEDYRLAAQAAWLHL
ncbi:hypothetical protein [Caulobacter sp. UNC279MFTsu5.1]|uniref:hypothetical protein n=1 Tax=Caulobacter sp. UNC279MFTsu5.1 TaxID=1502775 RepID=UPI0008E9686B|nr:hypothetical protein [Caulobacter sp. UNC279MFTsu5.1]SFI84122.1 hypothetical protein SAMN02799626_00659 [Caulobacter sp. UNC279MFTsu5.1]